MAIDPQTAKRLRLGFGTRSFNNRERTWQNDTFEGTCWDTFKRGKRNFGHFDFERVVLQAFRSCAVRALSMNRFLRWHWSRSVQSENSWVLQILVVKALQDLEFSWLLNCSKTKSQSKWTSYNDFDQFSWLLTQIFRMPRQFHQWHSP